MSRAKRRTGQARSRRTPVPSGGGTRTIPIVPILVVVGIAVVVGLIGYLIWQQSQPAGDPNSKWVKVEADPAPDLPGEFVNLQEIYDGTYGAHGENTTAAHVTRDVDYTADGNTNPPAGGPHWGRSACSRDGADSSPPFCGPAPWGIYREPWEPESVVHNMEHAGIVLWYNFTDTALRDELEDIIKNQFGNELIVMMPYPDMEEETIAITSWARIDKFPVSEYSKDRIEDYIDAHAGRFNPEGF